MLNQTDLLKHFFNPITFQDRFEENSMELTPIPDDIKSAIPVLPKNLYCNKLVTQEFFKVFRELIKNDLHKEILSFDGIFNPRLIRGSSKISLHAFGLAIDLNADEDKLGQDKSTWSDKFVQTWKDCGWLWGGDFADRKDPMHFEWSRFTN